ncbi:MAG: hypothetical protein II847_08520, partial [Ruminobacter sp.]|uniref:hypothetical protein n=1 Tax=Ruminobacter sp. TaxID=2774296 RepID=UPI00257AD1C6
SGWKMLMTGFAIKFVSEIVDGFKSIISTGLEASRVYEDMSARLTPLVGDLETAQKTFWSLNGLEDETATATDKLAKAFVDLGNNGLTNSNEQLKTYATIAHGTGRDINTLTDAVIAFSQGSTKALRQFGITAKDNGDNISLTYKGSTTEIQKNSKALDEYLSNLARNNFDGVLEAKLNTVSAATGRLDNAWGTFCTRLMQSNGGFGELIIMGNDFLANTLNGISEWLDDPAVTEWFHNLAKTVKETFEGIRTAWECVKDFFSDTLDVLGIEFEDGTGSWKLFFFNFFQFSQIGLLKLSQKIGELWDNTVGYLNAIGEGIGTLLAGGSFSEGFANRRERTKREAEEAAKIYEATIADIENGITESQKKIAAERQRLAEKYQKNPVGQGTQSDDGLKIGTAKDKGPGKGKSSGGGNSKSAEARDTWSPYYEQILELDMKSKSDLEQLEMEYIRKLSEFNAVVAENAKISETEKNNALLIIEQDYQRQRAEIEKSARDFLQSLNPEEEEFLRLQENYGRKLEMLEQYHNDRLISEENYLKAHAAIMDEYTSESTSVKQKKQAEELQKSMEPYEHMADATISISDAFTDLTENMNESSGAYRSLLAVQKSFAVASATMDAVQAWIKALNDPSAVTWPQKLANYASAVATTTSAISQLTSVSMHDKGGQIKAGEWGIVGEYGPELVQGPMSVTSRKETAELARSAMTGNRSGFSSVVVNLYESPNKAGSVEQRGDDEQRIIDIFVADIRHGGTMSRVLQNTFSLNRLGT